MKKIVLIAFFLIGGTIYAQSSKFLESVVIESDTSNPVAEAKVKIEDLDIVTYTDAEGNFSFDKKIKEGDYVISVSKDNYQIKYFVIEYREGRTISLKNVKIDVTKKEAKRRRKEEKKRKKEIEKRLKRIKKENEEKEKEIAKAKKRLLKENSVDIVYDSIKVEEAPVISEIQKKYATILEVDAMMLTNKKLYEFIDKWMGTPYQWGASTKEAIDCSAFTQRLFIKDKGMLIERTAQKQFDSDYSDKFKDKQYLKEGDLLFFGKDRKNVTHVGVYLHNNKFVHATSRKVDGPSGVKISDLNHPTWSRLLISAGRRINNE